MFKKDGTNEIKSTSHSNASEYPTVLKCSTFYGISPG